MKAIAIYTWTKGQDKEHLYYKAYDKVDIEKMMIDAQWAFDSSYYLVNIMQYKTTKEYKEYINVLKNSDKYSEM